MNDKLSKYTTEFDPANYRQNLLKAFRRIFAGTIKETFLLNVYQKVEHDQRYNLIFLSTFNPEKELSVDTVACGSRFKEINICKMIVMCHYNNVAMLSDGDKGKLQESEAYKNKLVDDVIKMFRFERLATANYSGSSLESYFPLIYYVSLLTNHCSNVFDELNNEKVVKGDIAVNQLIFTLIYKILKKIKSCISLVELGATDELAIIFRTLIEIFLSFSILWDKSDNVIDVYSKFDLAMLNYNYGGAVPDNLKAEAKKYHAKEINYLNYGWLSYINEFSIIKDEKNPFSLGCLAKILDTKYSFFCPDFGSAIYKIYRSCNPQIHGTVLTMNYLEQELAIFQNIAVMLKFLCFIMSEHLFHVNYKLGDFDLIDELNTSLNESRRISDWLHDNQLALDKTNLDYINRYKCSLRMK